QGPARPVPQGRRTADAGVWPNGDRPAGDVARAGRGGWRRRRALLPLRGGPEADARAGRGAGADAPEAEGERDTVDALAGFARPGRADEADVASSGGESAGGRGGAAPQAHPDDDGGIDPGEQPEGDPRAGTAGDRRVAAAQPREERSAPEADGRRRAVEDRGVAAPAEPGGDRAHPAEVAGRLAEGDRERRPGGGQSAQRRTAEADP